MGRMRGFPSWKIFGARISGKPGQVSTQALRVSLQLTIPVGKECLFHNSFITISGLYLTGLAWSPGQLLSQFPWPSETRGSDWLGMGQTTFPGLSFITTPKSTNCVSNRGGSSEGNQTAVIRRKKNRQWASKNNIHNKEWCGRKSTGLGVTQIWVQISNLSFSGGNLLGCQS